MTFSELCDLAPRLNFFPWYLEGLTQSAQDCWEEVACVDCEREAVLARLATIVGPTALTADPRVMTQAAYDLAYYHLLGPYLTSCGPEQEIEDAAYLKDYAVARKALSSGLLNRTVPPYAVN
jgi:hypothetical protein